MLKAIIFDCDGVIADTEPLHFISLKRVLEEESISLTEKDYYREFLSLDDRGCFTKAFSKTGNTLSTVRLAELIKRKAAYLVPVMQSQLRLFPGVKEFIEKVSRHYPMAIASGARREEINLILKYGGLHNLYQTIVATEDVANGKPHPESFQKALGLLNDYTVVPVEPRECLVIEDSFHGIHAAHSAGMLCVAVTNSYSKEILSEADLVVDSLLNLSLEKIESLFEK